MKLLTKAALVAILMGGTVAAFALPATAQTADPYGDYYGPDPYGPPPPPDYGPPPPPDYGYVPPPPAYAPPLPAYGYSPDGYPYACDAYDYYNPPWGYPPDYCNYNVWYEPVYVGGLWYSGPIYYRDFGGERMFWLNGGWHHDEWRGARPAHIDWSRNMRWAGGIEHGRSFGGVNAVRGNYGGGFRGNYAGVARGNYGGIARGNYGAAAPHFAPQGGGGFRGFAGGGGAPHAFAQSQPNRAFRGFGGGGGFRGAPAGGGGFRGGQGGGGFRGGQGGGGHAPGGGGGGHGGGHHHG